MSSFSHKPDAPAEPDQQSDQPPPAEEPKPKKNKGGRPVGSKTKKKDRVSTHASVCQKCGSSKAKVADRKPRVVKWPPGQHNGKPATHRVTRTLICECGQQRIEEKFENWPNEK